MDKKEGIPFHYYLETTKYVNTKDGKPILSVDPGFPFLMTQYAIMNVRAQTAIPDRNQTLLPVLKDELKNNSSSLPNIVGSLLSI